METIMFYCYNLVYMWLPGRPSRSICGPLGFAAETMDVVARSCWIAMDECCILSVVRAWKWMYIGAQLFHVLNQKEVCRTRSAIKLSTHHVRNPQHHEKAG